MSSYLGDFLLGSTVSCRFTTVQATGAPTTLSGSPVIACYPSGSTTEITGGITLTVDYDSRTGFNNVAIVASGGNTFAVSTDYDIVITTGTVNSVSVVGYVVGTFSIQNRFTNVAQINGVSTSPVTTIKAVQGLTTADVVASVSGAVGSVTGAVGSVTGAVGSVTARVTANADQLAGQTVTAAAGVTFPSSVASPTNITAGTITTVTNLTNAPTAGDLTAAMKTSVTTAATAATPTAAAVTGSVGSVTGNVGGNVTGSVGSVASGGIAAASFAPSAIDAAALATDAVNEIADGFLNRDMSTGTDSGSTTVRTPRQALRVLRNKASITAGTLTVTKEDDSTTSWTAAVTTTAGDPISAIDPAGP